MIHAAILDPDSEVFFHAVGETAESALLSALAAGGYEAGALPFLHHWTVDSTDPTQPASETCNHRWRRTMGWCCKTCGALKHDETDPR